ncbi:hypothetical protein [Clostridium butyricum]|uniref:hypothetical protein n=1 Tax=Clostridium butyricum TaxID=1492 RepID=UPI00374F8F5B
MNLNSKITDVITSQGDVFSIERNSILISQIKGVFDNSNSIKTIILPSNAGILKNDWLVHSLTNQKYFIKDIEPLSKSNELLGLKAEYLSESDYKKSLEDYNKATFSIGTINGSAIVGNYNNATINNGYNLSEIRSLISSKPIEDQDELNKLIDRVEIITEDNQPVSKGTFAKFSELLAKHSDIAIALGSNLINWLATK